MIGLLIQIIGLIVFECDNSARVRVDNRGLASIVEVIASDLPLTPTKEVDVLDSTVDMIILDIADRCRVLIILQVHTDISAYHIRAPQCKAFSCTSINLLDSVLGVAREHALLNERSIGIREITLCLCLHPDCRSRRTDVKTA